MLLPNVKQYFWILDYESHEKRYYHLHLFCS